MYSWLRWRSSKDSAGMPATRAMRLSVACVVEIDLLTASSAEEQVEEGASAKYRGDAAGHASAGLKEQRS